MIEFLQFSFPPAFMMLVDAFLLLFLTQGKLFIKPKKITQGLCYVLMPSMTVLLHTAQVWNNLYMTMSIELMLYILFLVLWTKKFNLAHVYYALCYLLVSNCIRSELGLLSMKLMAYDVLYASNILVSISTSLGAAMLIGFCLAGIRWFIKKNILGISYPILALSFFSSLPYLFVRGINYWLPITNDEITGFIGLALLFSCALSLVIMLGSLLLISDAEYRRQLAQMGKILEQQQSRYELKITSIENVNRKYHDMKNVLLYLEKHGVDAEASKQIRCIMGDIKPYEIVQKTGNNAMDIILNEKLSICAEKNISCIPYINGSAFDYMDPVDICIIFGNAFDNAIECCERYEEPAYRQINIKATQRNGMGTILFRNSCLDPPELDGLFYTTKTDCENHGFGLSNIRSSVEKYGGEVSIHTDNGEFRLTILIPPAEEIKNA